MVTFVLTPMFFGSIIFLCGVPNWPVQEWVQPERVSEPLLPHAFVLNARLFWLPWSGTYVMCHPISSSFTFAISFRFGVAEPEPIPTPQDGFVDLRDGGVLPGRTSEGDGEAAADRSQSIAGRAHPQVTGRCILFQIVHDFNMCVIACRLAWCLFCKPLTFTLTWQWVRSKNR